MSIVATVAHLSYCWALVSSIKSATCWTTAQQVLSDNAALPRVTGCVDAVVLWKLADEAPENTSSSVKKTKSVAELRELLKQKLSVLHASSTVRATVCQFLCTAPLEIFQMQVLTNNPGHRRPMNTRILWYLTDSLVGLLLVLSTQD